MATTVLDRVMNAVKYGATNATDVSEAVAGISRNYASAALCRLHRKGLLGRDDSVKPYIYAIATPKAESK